MTDLEAGMRTRREVLGDEHADRAQASASPLTEPFQELITLRVEEIGEILLHSAVYAGVPAANSAFAAAQEVLRADGLIE